MAYNKHRTGGEHGTKKSTPGLNSAGTSRAKYAGQPNEEDWVNDGLILENEEEAIQCAAEQSLFICNACEANVPVAAESCKECGGTDFRKDRCQNIAVPGYATCGWHGGGQKRTKHQLAAQRRGSITTGLNVTEVLLCPCKLHEEKCQQKNLYYDDEGISRCLPEKQFFDAVVIYMKDFYGLDDAADMLMLNRLAMTLTRIRRGEKLLAEQDEVQLRTRVELDGSTSTWYEPSAVGKVVDQLDRRLQAWLKELSITRASRNGKYITVNGQVDIASALCDAIGTAEETIDV